MKKKTILIINKIDLVDAKKIADLIDKYKNLYDFVAIIPVSVKKDKNIEEKEIEMGETSIDLENKKQMSIETILAIFSIFLIYN